MENPSQSYTASPAICYP